MECRIFVEISKVFSLCSRFYTPFVPNDFAPKIVRFLRKKYDHTVCIFCMVWSLFFSETVLIKTDRSMLS